MMHLIGPVKRTLVLPTTLRKYSVALVLLVAFFTINFGAVPSHSMLWDRQQRQYIELL